MSTSITSADSPSGPLLSAILERRSVYGLTNKSTIPDEKLHEIVKHAVLHTPTSFNNQSIRAVLLVKDSHIKLWDIVIETLRAVVSAERFQATHNKLKTFQAGYGTVLYFTDLAIVRSSQAAFPSYQDQFPIWAANSQGILQGLIWTAFAKEGLGASLQHYGNLINEKVLTTFDLPKDWELSAQAPFGIPSAEWKAPEKQFNAIEERVKFFQ